MSCRSVPTPRPAAALASLGTALTAAFTTAFVLLTLLAPVPAQAEDAYLLGDAVKPTFERVVMDLDPASDQYSGYAHVDLTVYETTSSFRFHAEEMELKSVVLTDAAGHEVAHTFAAIDGGRVEVTTASPLTPGVYSLRVDFANDYGNRAVGLYKAEFQGDPYLFTQFEAADAREAFPVWDEPAAKIPYQMVFTVPSGLMAVTNTPEVARYEHDGKTTVTFAPSQPMPSYLIAIAVGPFEGTDIEGLGVPGRVLAPRGMGAFTQKAAETTPAILHALEDYFGRPYPYAKLDLLAVPEFWPGAMENVGLITFADNVLLLDPAGASTQQLRTLIRVNAHEIAHMWFGDLVTMQWWDDLWLNESFADWMANKITDQLYPEFEIDLFSRRGIQGILSVDARPTTQAIRQPVARPEEAMNNVGLAYAKGRSVLGMVENWLGEDTFRRGVVAYLNKHAGGNAVGADLWQALSEASGKDVAGVLEGFLEQPGYPLLSVDTFGKDGVRITQQRFLNYGVEAPALTWQVPVSLKWSDGLNVHTHELLLTEATTSFHLPGPVAWVMPDAGANGYYRWRLPEHMLHSLASSSAEVLTPAERIAFLGNSAALLDAGLLGGDDYLGVLNAFAADPQPDVVAAVVGSLGKVQNAFVPDELRAPFAVYVRRTLRPALERFGMQPRPGEAESVALFRPQLLGWLGGLGKDPQVLAYADKLAQAYLADPSSVDPSLAGTALGLAARKGDSALWERYREGFEKATTPSDRNRFLGSLGDFEDPKLQIRALDYTLSGPLRPTEIFNIPGSVANSPGGDERTYAWFLDHYDAIADKLPPEFRPFLVGIAGGCSAERLATATEFFSDPSRQAPGTMVQLGKVTAQVNDCVSLRQREGEAVAAYLRSLGDEGAGTGSAD